MNDNHEKRNLNWVFYLKAYIYPSILALIVCSLVCFITNYYNLDRFDLLFGCLFGIGLGCFFYIKNRFKWIKSSDSYIYIGNSEVNKKNECSYNDLLSSEPSIFVAAFYIPLSSKIINVIFGLAIIGIGVYFLSKSSIIFPSIIMFGGVFMIYSGCKELMNRSPKIKITDGGVWTELLGFKSWDSIRKFEINIEKSGRSKFTYLDIFLKANDFDCADDRILINELKNGDQIKPMIDELFHRG
jgi:hypothetical protein